MPRSRRPGRRGAGSPAADERFVRFLASRVREEVKRGRAFRVQPLSPDQARKTYTCPGCAVAIEPGTAHLVVWRADGVLGDAADLADRRHWHEHCWRIA